MSLWHFTCEHGRHGIGDRGVLLPAVLQRGVDASRIPAQHRWLLALAWATDLDAPDIAGLGLTRHTIQCERWRHRYRLTDTSHMHPWHRFARTLPAAERELLEGADGALPAHWWITSEPVPVVYDPALVTA